MAKITSIPSWQDIQETHERIAPFIHRTPVLTSQSINRMTGAEIYFKCENFQKIGAFKIRGATNAGMLLTEEERKKGITTHSSGNHAQACALTAKNHDVPAYIVMPENAPKIKKAAVKGYGAEIIECEPTLEARETTLEKVQARTGATFIHPYNDYHVIAGQATCAKELLEDVSDLQIVMCPVGGGGLASGTALSTHYMQSQTKFFGAEPKNVDDAFRSLQTGKVEPNPTTDTIADGLKTTLGEKTLDILQKHIEEIITVSEEEIVAAMRLIWERMKIIIEPSCAVPLAALIQQKEKFQGKKVGIILTGGNVDLGNLPF